MTNLTITVDEALLKRARMRALEHGTSVDAVLRAYLESCAGVASEREAAAHAILELSDTSGARHDGVRWARDQLYDR